MESGSGGGGGGGVAALASFIMNEEELKRKQREKLKKLQATGGNPRPPRSLFFFTLKNPFRKTCINIVEWKYPSNLHPFCFHSFGLRFDVGLVLNHN